MQSIKQTIFGKKYKLLIAKTDKQKKKGMNIFSKPQKGIGMIFPYRQEKPNRSFTLAKCPFSLKIIFLDKDNNIVHQEIGKKYQPRPVVCKKPSMTVIELFE
tara:strand:- start:364 stop:669 length:306 start_codon:yes stop_codon:yes gene_type:complete